MAKHIYWIEPETVVIENGQERVIPEHQEEGEYVEEASVPWYTVVLWNGKKHLVADRDIVKTQPSELQQAWDALQARPSYMDKRIEAFLSLDVAVVEARIVQFHVEMLRLQQYVKPVSSKKDAGDDGTR